MNRCILISHAPEDQPVAELLCLSLRHEDANILARTVALARGDSLVERMRGNLVTGDYLIVLLSRHTTESLWLDGELAGGYVEHLEQRNILVLPILIDNCGLPAQLKERVWLDVSAGTEGQYQDLVRRLPPVLRMDFSALTAEKFEALVFDLLEARGFSPTILRPGHRLQIPVQPPAWNDRWAVKEKETAYLCTLRDRPKELDYVSEDILVQTKFYGDGRADLASLAGLHLTCSKRPNTHGVVFTNSQLTSATRRWLTAVEPEKNRIIFVVEGPQLKRLLLDYPDLVERYFPAPKPGDADPS